MAYKAMDVQEQRVRFVLAASLREKLLGVLCGEFGISRPRGGLWIKRYAECGLGGIAERSQASAQLAWADQLGAGGEGSSRFILETLPAVAENLPSVQPLPSWTLVGGCR